MDSLYRALPKMMVQADKGLNNVRLDYKDINRFLEGLFEEGKDIERS